MPYVILAVVALLALGALAVDRTTVRKLGCLLAILVALCGAVAFFVYTIASR